MFPLQRSHLLFLVLSSGALAAQERGEPSRLLLIPENPLEAVRSTFNAAKGKPRFVAVLSPT